MRRDERRDEAEERATDELRICGVVDRHQLRRARRAHLQPAAATQPTREVAAEEARVAALGGGEEDSGVAVGAGRRGRVRARGEGEEQEWHCAQCVLNTTDLSWHLPN